MQAYLQRRKLWWLVNGSEPKPASSEKEDLKEWKLCAEEAGGRIYQMLSSDMKTMVAEFLDDPVTMWKTLETHHVSKKPVLLDVLI